MRLVDKFVYGISATQVTVRAYWHLVIFLAVYLNLTGWKGRFNGEILDFLILSNRDRLIVFIDIELYEKMYCKNYRTGFRCTIRLKRSLILANCALHILNYF